MSEQWYWCLTHGEPEPSGMCPSEQRMGPYASPEEARAWRERHDERADGWEQQDEAAKDAWDREDDAWAAGD